MEEEIIWKERVVVREDNEFDSTLRPIWGKRVFVPFENNVQMLILDQNATEVSPKYRSKSG